MWVAQLAFDQFQRANVFVGPFDVILSYTVKNQLSQTLILLHLNRSEFVKTIYHQDVVKMQHNHCFIIKTPFLTIWITWTPSLTETHELLLKYKEILQKFMEPLLIFVLVKTLLVASNRESEVIIMGIKEFCHYCGNWREHQEMLWILLCLYAEWFVRERKNIVCDFITCNKIF